MSSQRLSWRWLSYWDRGVIPLHQPVMGQRLPQGMGAIAYQASLDEANVISLVHFYRGGCRCEKLVANTPGNWRMGTPAQWKGSEWGTNSTYYKQLLTPRGICVPRRWPNLGVDSLCWGTLGNLGEPVFCLGSCCATSHFMNHTHMFLWSLASVKLSSLYLCILLSFGVSLSPHDNACKRLLHKSAFSHPKLYLYISGKVGSITPKGSQVYFATKLIITSLM